MTTRHHLSNPIVARVSRWPGVETTPEHGRIVFLVDGHGLGDLDADGTLTAMTTPTVRDQLLTDGMADRSPGHTDRVTYRVRSPADVPGAIRLLRVAYLCNQESIPAGRPDLGRLGVSEELLTLVASRLER